MGDPREEHSAQLEGGASSRGDTAEAPARLSKSSPGGGGGSTCEGPSVWGEGKCEKHREVSRKRLGQMWEEGRQGQIRKGDLS